MIIDNWCIYVFFLMYIFLQLHFIIYNLFQIK